MDIINDTINEFSETFTITVRPEGSPDSPASTTVTIEDDDSENTFFCIASYWVNLASSNLFQYSLWDTVNWENFRVKNIRT